MADGDGGPVVISISTDSDSDGFCIEAAPPPPVPSSTDGEEVKAEAAAGGFDGRQTPQREPSSPFDSADEAFAASPSTPGSEDIGAVRGESSAQLGGDINQQDAAGCNRDQEEVPAEDHQPVDADADAEAEAPPSGGILTPPHEEHNPPELFSCPFCPEALPDAESMQEHCAKEHYCPACDRYDIASMAQHVEEHHKSAAEASSGPAAAAGGFVCCEEGCEETFETEQEMLEHYGSCPVAQPSSSQKPDEAARDRCPCCSKVYPKKMTMRARTKHEEACMMDEEEEELPATATRRTRASKKQKRKAPAEAEVEGNGQEPNKRPSTGQNGAASSKKKSPKKSSPRKFRKLSDIIKDPPEEPPAPGPSSAPTTAAATATTPPEAPQPPVAVFEGADSDANAAAAEEGEEFCCFCGRGDESATAEEGSLKRFYPPNGPEILCHEPCAAFCDKVKWVRCAPLSAAEVAAEATRASGCGCAICGRQGGAALTCLKCPAAFHLPCARERARKFAGNMSVFVFSDIDPKTGESHGGVLCPQHASQRDSWRDFDAGPRFSGVWFESAPGGWRSRAHGISYRAAVAPEGCEAPPELRRSDEAAAAAAEAGGSSLLDGGTELLGVVMSRDAAALCREQMQKWAESRKEADDALDAEAALFGDGMTSPDRKGPRSLEEQLRSLSAPASLDVVNLEAERSPGGRCPVCRPGSPSPCECLRNVRQLILEQIPMRVSMKIRKETGRIDPEDLPKRLGSASDDLRIAKVQKNDPRKHLAERRDYTVLAARRFERGDVVARFKGYICTTPEFRQELKGFLPDGFSSKDEWHSYIDEASHDLVSDAPWQKTNSTKLTLSTYRMPPDAPLKPKRPVFCGNEAILIRQSVASRGPKARSEWNSRYFDLGKLEKAKVDSVMHFHRHDTLGNVDIMEFAVCGFPFPFIIATAPIEEGEELLLPPILDFWRYWNVKNIPLLQHPKLSVPPTANGSEGLGQPKTNEANAADDDNMLPARAAMPPTQEMQSQQIPPNGGGRDGAMDVPDNDTMEEDGFDLDGRGAGAPEDDEASSEKGDTVVEWAYADAQLVLARRSMKCLWSEVAANEGPGFVTGQAAAAARQAARQQAGVSEGPGASSAAPNPSLSAAAAPRPRGSALRRGNVNPWENAQPVRSKAGGFISRIRSREGQDRNPGAS